jgi:Zn ribbon nucleic-acid-binding protein
MNQARFINARGAECPACNSKFVKVDEIAVKIQDGIGHHDFECHTCKSKWTAQYMIVGFTNFKQGRKK